MIKKRIDVRTMACFIPLGSGFRQFDPSIRYFAGSIRQFGSSIRHSAIKKLVALISDKHCREVPYILV
ncbi:hypothetical protein ACIQXF_09575 [Lysinibacillus sp. NPDC097231]|uniref:hypothetical protein n=1 Tax=Lysinibacillus sp. NPDC097231 TaxID=3364142 RepID=UPI00382E7FBB